MKKLSLTAFLILALIAVIGCSNPSAPSSNNNNGNTNNNQETEEEKKQKKIADLMNEVRAKYGNIEYRSIDYSENFDNQKKLVLSSDKLIITNLTNNQITEYSLANSNIVDVKKENYSDRYNVEFNNSTKISRVSFHIIPSGTYANKAEVSFQEVSGSNVNLLTFREYSTSGNSGGNGQGTSGVNGTYSFNNATGSQTNGSFSLSNGNWTYSGSKSNVAASSGTYTVNGSKITINWNANSYDNTETFNVTTSGNSSTWSSENTSTSLFFNMLFGVTDLQMTFNFSE